MEISCRVCVRSLQRAAVVQTSGVPADEEFSDFIIDEDEETVGERAQPPGRPEEEEGEEEQSQMKGRREASATCLVKKVHVRVLT